MLQKIDRKEAMEIANLRRGLEETYSKDLYEVVMTKKERKEIADYQFTFRMTFDETEEERDQILRDHKIVAERLKGSIVSKLEFWERYFWRCDVNQILRQAKLKENEIQEEAKKKEANEDAMPGEDYGGKISFISKDENADDVYLNDEATVQDPASNDIESENKIGDKAIESVNSAFDGRWRVEWKIEDGTVGSNIITVTNGIYKQSGFQFKLVFLDPQHPFIAWPKSSHKQTVKNGVDLIHKPNGPMVGEKICWETTSARHPEIVWIRESILSEDNQQKEEKKAKRKAKAQLTANGNKQSILLLCGQINMISKQSKVVLI
jgi:hypothetical protein